MEKRQVTIYFSTEIMGCINKIEAAHYEASRAPHAQYDAAVHVRFRKPLQRNDRGFVKGHRPHVLILDGWGHPEPDSMFMEPKLSESGCMVAAGRYSSCDPRWRTDFDAMIDEHIERTGATVLFDVREQLEEPPAVRGASIEKVDEPAEAETADANKENGEQQTNFEHAQIFLQIGHDHEFEDSGRKFRLHRFWNCIQAVDVTDGGRRGKTCKIVTIDAYDNHEDMPVEIDRIEKLVPVMLSHEARRDCYHLGKLRFHVGNEKAIRVWNMDNIKPLEKAPKKWTVDAAVRALACGQAENVRNTFSHSNNLRAVGPIDGACLARKITENPSGWWVHADNGTVHVSCCTFDCNEFEPCI